MHIVPGDPKSAGQLSLGLNIRLGLLDEFDSNPINRDIEILR